MIEIAPGRVMVKSPMTMASGHELLKAGDTALHPGMNVFDFAAVTEADSSAVAVMLGWLRVAAERNATLEFRQVPAGVRSLAELYGVLDLLPIV